MGLSFPSAKADGNEEWKKIFLERKGRLDLARNILKNMEQYVLIISVLTLLLVIGFFFVYWKNLKEQKQLSEKRFQQIIAQLEGIEKANYSLTKEITELWKSTSNNSKELSDSFKNEFNGIKSENKQFKTTLTESHAETLKSIKSELQNILKEIKTPLPLD